MATNLKPIICQVPKSKSTAASVFVNMSSIKPRQYNMTPLPENPRVVVLVQNGHLIGASTNVHPDTEITLVDDKLAFEAVSKGLPFSDSIESPAVSEKALLEEAWAIISNVGAGNWQRESKTWQADAAIWRDVYLKHLD